MAYGLRRAERMANGRWQEAPSASIAPVALDSVYCARDAARDDARDEIRATRAYSLWQMAGCEELMADGLEG